MLLHRIEEAIQLHSLGRSPGKINYGYKLKVHDLRLKTHTDKFNASGHVSPYDQRSDSKLTLLPVQRLGFLPSKQEAGVQLPPGVDFYFEQ